MKRLAEAIAERVIGRVHQQLANLRGSGGEFRAVFNGPPEEILAEVFQLLTKDGGIDVMLLDGSAVVVPVVMQVDRLPTGGRNPDIGKSGLCDEHHLLDLRNSPNCPIFVGLVPPGHQGNLSQTSTRSDFGLAAQNNSGAAKISDWWRDAFIQDLVHGALGRYDWPAGGFEQAMRLIERAIFSADEIDKRERHGAWFVLSRLWSISNGEIPFGNLVALACGYPPSGDGVPDADAQIYVLKELSSRIEDASFRPAIERIKLRADGEVELTALDELLTHLQRKCDVPTALGRATSFYYGPFNAEVIEAPPDWWSLLTVERWLKLLEEERQRKESIKLACINSIISQIKGFVPVAQGSVALRIEMPDGVGPTKLRVTRDVAGAKNHREWTILVNGVAEIEDVGIPPHRAPVRYSAEVLEPNDEVAVKKGAIRVISLDNWEPGVIACSRTASKGAFPKVPRSARDKISYESTLIVNGQGRHYLDVYVRPDIEICDTAYGSGDGGLLDESNAVSIAKVCDGQYGFEVDATSDCFYQFEITKPDPKGGKRLNETIRVYLTADEITPEECGSEFERLIRLNRQDDKGRATTDVYIDRHLRCSDLQAWMLADGLVDRSFYPLVLAADYATDWHTPDWSSRAGTILSKGKFLNDPRPSPEEMQPPDSFIKCRAELMRRVRGEDQDGFLESARLGEWLVADTEFSELVEGYVRSYLEWLESAPEIAAWCDLSVVVGTEPDGVTLVQVPDAVLVSPLHPVRFAWHCLAQRALFLAQRRHPCPAASILDPDAVPDAIVLPLRTTAGGIKWQCFISIECSSDYWSILWNGARLDKLNSSATEAPFDAEFGVQVGGVSSGFSVSQVHRALGDVSGMLVAKPVLNVLVSSAAGQNNACNEGLVSWCREHFLSDEVERPKLRTLGGRLIQILDDRKTTARPEDAEISNLAEDTGNAVRWFEGSGAGITPDLGIIAQLETSNAGCEEIKLETPLAVGGLLRSRIRQQLKAGAGAFLCETRMGKLRPPSGDGLADKTMAAIVRLENLSEARYGYVFAPSISAIESLAEKADYAAVSSSAVDPACFLGGWLKGVYLWDYDLPSYSSRAGDSNGYYLLSKIKELDRESLQLVLSRLPECKDLSSGMIDKLILEVARRGIPTVRGLSGGDSGASGDLGLLVAARLLQDEFRIGEESSSLLPVWTESDDVVQIVLVMPVDPFKGYLEDLGRAMKQPSNQRPDLIVAGILVSASKVQCKLTPVEVKYRGGKGAMSEADCQNALQQARALSALLAALNTRSDEPEMMMWKLAFQHFLDSMLGFGFRVYSQQVAVSNQAEKWSKHHARVVGAIFSDEIEFELDQKGRLIVVDGSMQSGPKDNDNDHFFETMVLNHKDAASIVRGQGQEVYTAIKSRIKNWNLLPHRYEANVFDDVVPSATPSPKPNNQGVEGLTTKFGDTLGRNVPPAVATSTATETAKTTQDASVSGGGDLPSAMLREIRSASGGGGMNLIVGSTIDGFKEDVRYLNLSDTNLNQLNIGVVGDLGTGKTQLMKSLVYQISKGGADNEGVKPRILIFDYKKDYSSADFVDAVGARVIKPQHLPINLFDIAGAGESLTPWLDRFKFFSDVLDKIYPGVGPVQRAQLKRAVRAAYDSCELQHRSPNIYDVHQNYQNLLGNKADSVSAIIDDLVDMELFSPEPTSVTSFDEFLDGIVVISLDVLGQDDRTKNMLVAIMLNLFYEHMLRIPKRPYVGAGQAKRRVVDSFLLVDEADNIMRYEFDVLRKILLQGREFGVGVILASQYLRHFKTGGTDYREPLLSWFIHKVPNVTPQELAALGLTGDVVPLSARIKSLSLHECLFKTFNVAGEMVKGVPFYEFTRTNSGPQD